MVRLPPVKRQYAACLWQQPFGINWIVRFAKTNYFLSLTESPGIFRGFFISVSLLTKCLVLARSVSLPRDGWRLLSVQSGQTIASDLII
jgi:hypothetical protein